MSGKTLLYVYQNEPLSAGKNIIPITTNNLNNGPYIVKVVAGNQVTILKMMVSK